MTFKKYVTEEAPRLCGVNPAFGALAWLAVESEMAGNKAFSKENFKSMRERASGLLPYKPVNEKNYERCLDVMELACLNNDERKNKTDHSKRMVELDEKNIYSDHEIEATVSAMEFWSP